MIFVNSIAQELNLQTYDSWEDVDESPEGYDDNAPLPPCRIDHDVKAELVGNFCREVQQDPTKFLANFDENRIEEKNDDSSLRDLETDLAFQSVWERMMIDSVVYASLPVIWAKA